MSHTVTLQQVLARIEGPEMPDVDQLAEIPLDELERQLAALGVDLSGEVDELLEAAGVRAGPRPLETLRADELAVMSVDEVEQRLRAEGVDVAQYLARALSLIRPRAVTMADPASRTRRRGPLHLAGQDSAPGRDARPRRGMPRALAASIVAVSVAGVVFTLVHQQGLVDRSEPAETASLGSSDSHREAPPVRDSGDESPAQARTQSFSDEAVAEQAGQAPAQSTGAPASAVAMAPEAPPDVAPGRERPSARSRAAELEAAPTGAREAAAAGSRQDAALPMDTDVARSPSLAKSQPGLMSASPAAARQVSVLTLELAPEQRLENALAPVALDKADRDALVELLSDHDTGPAGRLRLVLEPGGLVSARLQRGAGPPAVVERSPDGTLRRAP